MGKKLYLLLLVMMIFALQSCISFNTTGINFPFLAIDFDYYNTKNYSKGIERMYRALGCGEDWWQLYSLFYKGEFIGSSETLDDLMKIYESKNL